MAGPIQEVIEEDAADLQFPKGTLINQNLIRLALVIIQTEIYF